MISRTNFLKKPMVSTMGRTTEIAVEAKTQMKEITTQAVKKPLEKMYCEKNIGIGICIIR